VVPALVSAVLAVVVGTLLAAATKTREEIVATVDVTPITRDAMNGYAAVLADKGVKATSSVVLESLINQALVEAEARREGVHIDDRAVDAAVAQWERLGASRTSLDRSGGIAALRERERLFLLFEAVKRSVIAVTVTDEEVVAAQRRDPLYASLAVGDISPAARGDLLASRRQAAWIAWLARQRACSSITIIDPSLTLAEPGPCR
jgi:hypothetical protein